MSFYYLLKIASFLCSVSPNKNEGSPQIVVHMLKQLIILLDAHTYGCKRKLLHLDIYFYRDLLFEIYYSFLVFKGSRPVNELIHTRKSRSRNGGRKNYISICM